MSDLHVNTLRDDERRKKRKRAAAGFFVSVVAIVQHTYCRRRIRELDDFSEDEAEIRVRKQMLKSIYQGSNKHCFDSLRLTKRSFVDLCAILRERCGLRDTFYVSVEESVTMFLLVLSHGMKYRLIESTYRWALETISRHFNEILRSILSLSHEFIKLPSPSAEQPEDTRWKWFPDGLGALDGTHVDVRVSARKQGRYRNRKQDVTTNVLGVCDRNMKFLYVLAGWEGSASDSRVLRDAMSRQDAFRVPHGKYYLVDAGYTNGPGFFAPYRSVRYHLKEWAANGNNPQTPRELYNLRHASARNVVERTFGLLKMRWAILRTSSFFDIRNQANKDAACYRHKVIKFWDSISLVFSKDHATGTGARTASESVAEMAAENVNNINIESAATSSTQTGEEPKRKRYRSDDSIASMLGEKLDNFTSAYKADIAQVAPLEKPSSPEEILDALNAVVGLDDDGLLAAYDILIADDCKFKALMALPERMKKKWILKQINQ